MQTGLPKPNSNFTDPSLQNYEFPNHDLHPCGFIICHRTKQTDDNINICMGVGKGAFVLHVREGSTTFCTMSTL